MKKIILLSVCLASLMTLKAQMADYIIRNGKLIDGSGNNWQYKDVAIQNNKIVAIGNLKAWKATKEIDAKGLIIAPGFIDVHAHIEGGESRNPLATNFIYDGVTTVITGNCGGSADNLKTYFNAIDSIGTSINVASLIGHNTIRKQAMGTANRNATAAEMKNMEQLAQQAMNDGAVGMSTGLIYIPGTYAPTEEIVALAKVISANGGVYSSHIRYEEDRVLDAINEAIQVGRAANIPVEISHFKVSGQNNWGRSKETIPMVMNARKEGIDVTIDQYPYTASSTQLSLTYEDVEGTPFWNEHWNSALLYFKSGTIYTLPKAKLNLYTTEVHYENEKGVELVAETILIDKIVFLNSKDATKVLAAFAVLPDYIDNKPAGFFRVFNDGAYQLILLQKNLVKVSPFDPLTGKNITSFFTKYYYGIYNNGKTIPLKALDRNSILSVIPFNASVEPWIKNTKNKLKSEEDIIALLKYYNSIVAVK